jgi:hypothetical protein
VIALDPARYAEEARLRGLYVLCADGAELPIPPVFPATVAPDLDALSADASRLVRAAVRAADRLPIEALGAAAPLERTCLEARRARAASGVPLQLATARVDYMAGRALEINATIPAMQGYSDIVVEALLAAAGAPPALCDQNGRNSEHLIDALCELAAGARRIAIVARSGDAQRGELLHYIARLALRGIEARVVTPGDIRIVRPGRLEAFGQPIDLCYRHVFTWRVDPACDFARALVEPWIYRIVNPVALDVEAKATLAELSRAAAASESWLPDDERDAVNRRVPWSRRLDAATAGLAERDRERMVLKRSWDYGGRAVFLGIDTEPSRWRQLLDQALGPNDIWIVQERVVVPTERRRLVTQGGAEEQDCFVDVCAFASLGVQTQPRGGASRVAATRIVNLLGGGGLAPLLRPEIAAVLPVAAPSASG